MGQKEVIELLKKEKKPLSRGQIAEKLLENPVKISHIIKRLTKYREIKCMEVDRVQSGKLLGMDSPFHRMRFYYI